MGGDKHSSDDDRQADRLDKGSDGHTAKLGGDDQVPAANHSA